ncbi:PCSK1 (predicted) [Pycnogonum litorale]
MTQKDDETTKRLLDYPVVESAEQMVISSRKPRVDEYGYGAIRNIIKRDLSFNDPLWEKQWYMNDNVRFSGTNKISLNVEKAWKMGYTGKGVVVAVVDDGVEWTHDDLKNNYNSNISTDITDDDNDPSPASGNSNSHGTKCAGLISMEKNNNKCGVGVAHDCTLAGTLIYFILTLRNLLYN